MFSFKDRPKILDSLNRYSFDVLVIGGGITGAGIALDAASRGLSVALVEMQDFASGTSSRSTKLVHGGLRYLKQLEFGLVSEVGKEREIVYENAVHVTAPEKMILPIYKEGTLGAMTTSVALRIYDKLANVKKEERRKMLSKKETLKLVPLLKEDGLKGSGEYVEYKTDDARLTLEVIKKAVDYQAVCLNYAKVIEFVYKKKKLVGAKVRDEITGETITIHATQIVNATGPWVDTIQELDVKQKKKNLMLTKGIHIVIDESKFPLKHAVYFDTQDGRMIFAIPRDKKVYVGTTDTFYKGDPSNVKATKEDVEYLLDAVRFIFPKIHLTTKDVESTWAGIRPLITEKGKKPSEISRKDEIWESPSGLLTIAGGKLTGYRKMAEDVVDQIIKRNRFRHATECMTQQLYLSGAKGLNSLNFHDYVKNKAKIGVQLGLSNEEAKQLVRRYGTNVDDLFQYVNVVENSNVNIPLALYAELLYTIYYEMVYTPCDFFIRRTGYLYFDIEKVEKYKDEVLDIMSNIIGYSKNEKLIYKNQLEQQLEEAKNPTSKE